MNVHPPWNKSQLAAGLFVGSVASTALGFLLGRWVLALFGAIVPYLVFLPRIRDGRFAGAWGWVLVWAVFQSVVVIGAPVHDATS